MAGKLSAFIKNNPYNPKLQGYTQAAAGVTSLLPEEDNPYAYDRWAPGKAAAQGAQLGSTFGAAGALAGAAIGGVAGGVGEAINQSKELDRTPTTFQTVTYDEYGQPTFEGGKLSQGLSNLQNINSAYAGKHEGLDFNVNKLRKTRNKLAQGIETAQNQFNDANIAYNQNFLARQQYEDQLKKNNIYNFPMQLV
jgi:hypothetical protein